MKLTKEEKSEYLQTFSNLMRLKELEVKPISICVRTGSMRGYLKITLEAEKEISLEYAAKMMRIHCKDKVYGWGNENWPMFFTNYTMYKHVKGKLRTWVEVKEPLLRNAMLAELIPH